MPAKKRNQLSNHILKTETMDKLALNTTYSPKLNQVELQLFEASKSKTVLDLLKENESETVKTINQLVSSNLNSLGQKPKTANEISLIVIGLIEEIETYFKSLTMQELKLASNFGIRGEFGEFMGLNVITYHSFIKTFLNGEKRKDAILKQIEHLAEQKRVKSAEEIAQIEKEFWENETKRISEFKKTGVLKTDSYERLYKIYESAGKISLSNSEKWDYFEKARLKVVESLKLEAQDSMKPKPIIEQIKRIESKQTTKLDDLKIADLACKMAIEDFYKKSI